MVTAKKSERSRKVATDEGLERFLPTSVQKSYFMLSDAERKVLNTALEKYRPGQSEPILVGGKKLLKPALRLMRNYRLVIEEVRDGQAVTSYTRWVDAVQVNGTENEEVYLTFSPRFEHIWLESKRRLLESAARKPPHIGLRSRYAIRLYAWAQKHRLAGSKRITLERLRTVLGLDSVKDPKGKVIRKAPLPVWAKPAPESAGPCNRSNQSENGPKHYTRVAGAISPSEGHGVDFFDQSSNDSKSTRRPDPKTMNGRPALIRYAR